VEKCTACDRPARGLALSLASEGMATAPRWEPYWTCEKLHRASDLAAQILAYDPGARVLAFTCGVAGDLTPGLYTLGRLAGAVTRHDPDPESEEEERKRIAEEQTRKILEEYRAREAERRAAEEKRRRS
jgi:hypothetical protein